MVREENVTEELKDRLLEEIRGLRKEIEDLKTSETRSGSAEESLQAERNRLLKILDSMPEAVYIVDSRYNLQYANPAAKKEFGAHEGEKCYSYLFNSSTPCPWCKFPEVIAGNTVHVEWDFPKTNKVYDVVNIPLEDFQGNLSSLNVARDVTDHKAVQEALRKTCKELGVQVEERTRELKREITENIKTVEELRKSEERLSEAQRIARIGNWDWDIAKNKLYWSGEIYRIFGREPQSFGATYQAFLDFVYPGDRESVKKAVDRALYERAPYNIEHRVVRPDGDVRYVHEYGGVSYDEDGSPLRMIGTVQDITDRRRAEDALRDSEQKLRELSTKLVEAQEKERKFVAQELHDSIGGNLSAIKFGLENKLRSMGGGELRAGTSLEDILSMLNSTIQEIRRISGSLRPSILDDLGLLAAIRWFCRNLQGFYSNMNIDQDINVREQDIPEHLKISIYRVLQEALNNAAKYSKSWRVHLSLSREGKNIKLFIRDGGQGFNLRQYLSREGAKGGLGLESMKDRTELSGGTFTLYTGRGTGTIVRAIWPCE